MNKRPYNSSGLSVSEIGFGAWQLGNTIDWAGMDDQTAFALVHEALDQGINFFDTAPNYALGRSEELLGIALKGRRDQVVINTKFGHHADGTDYSAGRIRGSLEGSLKRLQTDYVDSIILHNPPFAYLNGDAPHYEILEKLKTEGKIRAYGASVDSSKEMFEVLGATDSGVLEVMYNIFYQETSLAFAAAQEKQVALIVKIPLDSGWLSGKYNAQSRFDGIRGRWSLETIRRRAALLERIQFITNETTSMTQAALRFILAHPAVTTVIPGTRTLEQLKENASASEATMPNEHVERLRDLWEREIKGNDLGW